MKNFKRLLAVLVSAAMILCSLTITALAEDAVCYIEGGESYTSFTDAVDAAGNNDTIVLTGDIVLPNSRYKISKPLNITTDGTKDIIITSQCKSDFSLEINKQGTFGGASSTSRIIFEGNGATVTRDKGMFLVQGTAAGSTYKNIVFQNIKYDAASTNGPVYTNQKLIVFENCVFQNNSAMNAEKSNGGTFYSTGAGDVTFNNCRFTGNYSARNGGAVYAAEGGKIHCNGCTFTDNTCGSSFKGGAVYCVSSADFTDCTFSGNRISGGTATSSNSIYAADLTLTGCSFDQAQSKAVNAFTDGGGNTFTEKVPHLTLALEDAQTEETGAVISFATIFNNWNSSAFILEIECDGEMVEVVESVGYYVVNVSLKEGYAYSDEGETSFEFEVVEAETFVCTVDGTGYPSLQAGIEAAAGTEYPVVLTDDCEITQKIIVKDKALTITTDGARDYTISCSFAEDFCLRIEATQNGEVSDDAAVVCITGTEDSHIIFDGLKTARKKAMVLVQYIRADLTYVDFINANTAATGGALQISGNSTCNAKNCTFADNVTTGSSGNGAAVSVGKNTNRCGMFKAEGCVFCGNTASVGGIITATGAFIIDECNFEENTIDASSKIVEITANVFDRSVTNSTFDVYESVAYDMTNTTLTTSGNTCLIPAEPVAMIGDTKYFSLEEAIAEAEDGDIVKIVADIEIAGTITIGKSLTLTVDNTHTLYSAARGATGHMFIINAQNVTFTGASAAARLIIDGRNDELTEGTYAGSLIDVKATGFKGEYLTLQYGFTNGEKAGGALYIEVAGADFTNCIFDHNKYTNGSGSYGGGVFQVQATEGNTATFTNCMFTNNYADQHGGVANLPGKTSATLINCVVANNEAKGVGGAFYMGQSGSGQYPGRLYVSGTSFTANKAGGNGAAIRATGGFNIDDCTFSQNNSDGGDISVGSNYAKVDGYRSINGSTFDKPCGDAVKSSAAGGLETIVPENLFETNIFDDSPAGTLIFQADVNDVIALNFILKDYDAETDGVKLYASVNGEAQIIDAKAGDDGLAFTLKLYSQNMADSIEFAIRDADDRMIVGGTYSFAQYCGEAAQAANVSAELVTLMANLLEFGAKSQIYKNHNTDKLANAASWVGEAKTATPPVGATATSSQPDKDELFIKSATLNIGSRISLRYTIRAAQAPEVSIDLAGVETALADNGDGTYSYWIYDFNPADYSKVITLNATAGTAAAQVTYSVNTYLKNKAADEVLSGLVTAIYNYGTAAVAYNTSLGGGIYTPEDQIS